jgi:hypothetical protein
MGKRWLLAVVAAFPLSAYSYDSKAYCAEIGRVAGGSYQIEATCRKMELTSQSNIARMTVPARIEKYCRDIGQTAGGSYQIMETCIKQELGAKDSLR